MRNLIFWLATIAAFSLIFLTHSPIKLSDVLWTTVGILIVNSHELRPALEKNWPRIRSYIKYFLILVVFIVIGQIASHLHNYGAIYDLELFKNYGRIFFDGGVFLLVAFLVYCFGEKLVNYMGIAIFVSPLVVLPAFTSQYQKFYLATYRLGGLQQNPLYFGMWMVIVFLIGLGLFFTLRNKKLRFAVVIWLAVIANFILWSGSRSAWVSLIIALIFLFAFYFRRQDLKNAAGVIVVSVIAIFAGYYLLRIIPAVNEFEISGRILTDPRIQDNIENKITSFVANPTGNQNRIRAWVLTSKFIAQKTLGVGFGFGFANIDVVDYHPESPFTGKTLIIPGGGANTFLEIVVDGGIGALIIFIAFLIKLGKEIMPAIKKVGGRKLYHLELALLVAALATAIDLFFTAGFSYRFVWFIWGVALGISWLAEDAPHPT